MKSVLYRLLGYPIALIFVVFLFNIDISGQTEDAQELIKNSPFFDEWKVYYSLGVLIIISGLLEKSESPKIDNNLLLKILFCVISLFFTFLGYKFQPESENSVSYNWMDYFKMIFFGSIWIGLYVQMFIKSKKNN